MLRIGLFGLGRWGTHIVNTLRAMKGVEVEVFGARSSPGKTSRRSSLDGVIIATPGSTHAEVALPFIKAGIPTFIEKPLTTSKADARKLEQAAKKSGARIFVGHIHCYNPAYLVAKEQATRAGKLRYLYFEGMNNGPFRDDMSTMWDWAPHDVYVAMDLMGEVLPARVQAWGITTLRPHTSLYDVSVLKMTFPDGREALSITTWLFPEKRRKVTIVGEHDSVVFDDVATQKVSVYRGLGPRVARGAIVSTEPRIIYPRYSRKPALQAELEAFVHALTTGEQPRAGLEQGVAVVRVLAAAEKSMKHEGRGIRV